VVIIKKSPIHGKGVFVTENIPKGTIITCDILEVQKGKILKDYIYPFIGDRVCIHVGFGSFLNSSKTPNIKHVKIDVESKISYFQITKDVNLGEELFLYYGLFD
jgi:SET domain-containing protein